MKVAQSSSLENLPHKGTVIFSSLGALRHTNRLIYLYLHSENQEPALTVSAVESTGKASLPGRLPHHLQTGPQPCRVLQILLSVPHVDQPPRHTCLLSSFFKWYLGSSVTRQLVFLILQMPRWASVPSLGEPDQRTGLALVTSLPHSCKATRPPGSLKTTKAAEEDSAHLGPVRDSAASGLDCKPGQRSALDRKQIHLRAPAPSPAPQHLAFPRLRPAPGGSGPT